MVLNGVEWCLMVFIGVFFVFIGSYWCLLVFNGVRWCLMVFIDADWC